MITSIFKKSSPINYSIVVLFTILSFTIVLINSDIELTTIKNALIYGVVFVLIFAQLFLANFIAKKNALTKNSTYTALLFFLLLLFFPKVIEDYKLIISNFFILLAIRRLISLQTLKAPKEKIFDASLWVIIASIFCPWAILFILLVYFSIFLDVSRDYRNWLIPLVALFTVAVLFVAVSLVIDYNFQNHLNILTVSLDFEYFTNQNQNIAISFFAVLAMYFFVTNLIAITNRPLALQNSYKKIILAFILGFLVYFLSPQKSSEMLLFTFFPLAILGTNNVEYNQNKIYQEVVLASAIVFAFICFFIQL
jgi:hypothetical protein